MPLLFLFVLLLRLFFLHLIPFNPLYSSCGANTRQLLQLPDHSTLRDNACQIFRLFGPLMFHARCVGFGVLTSVFGKAHMLNLTGLPGRPCRAAMQLRSKLPELTACHSCKVDRSLSCQKFPILRVLRLNVWVLGVTVLILMTGTSWDGHQGYFILFCHLGPRVL